MGFDESQFIAWATAGGCSLPVGPGDDAAVLDDRTVLCVDTIVQGVHFDTGTAPERVAHKALGACISDVCAMGAEPTVVLVAAQLPPGTPGEQLAGALVRAAAGLGVELAGGDTVAAPPGALALSVTAVGRLPGPPWLRSGARPGDRLLVSGPLGGARSGRHLDVRPRTDVVAALRRIGTPVHACMDLSDGLGRDLVRLTLASGVGARVEAGALPIHPDVAPDRDPVEAALGDGEDFELLLAVPGEAPLPPGLTAIGAITADTRLLLETREGPIPWPPTGFTHAF